MSTVPPSMPPPGGTYTPPPPPPPTGGPAPSSDRTLMVVLSYLWILCLIPLLTKKDDSEVQWHAKNGLAILIAEIVCWVVFFIIGIVARHMAPAGCGIAVIQCVVWIAFLVIRVMAIIKGVNGQRFRVPVISDFADKM
ncbi:MAG TPA: DUF4870 domain-containing protein [Thermoanaerobaculia bacterium]|nr:DUF4870 domain-containing protein [Thermoanaerobaculia bacterium]